MKTIHTLIAALAASALIGCAGTPFEWEKVRQLRVGMTQQEVTALMGTPNNVTARADGTVWVWARVDMLAGQTRTASVVFRDGRVISVPDVPDSFK